MITESIADKEQRHAKLIGCPHCAAGSLQPCQSTKGKPVEKTHVKRYRAWRGRRRALAAAIAVASDVWEAVEVPEPNTDYRMRMHGGGGHSPESYAGVDEGRIRVIKVEVLLHEKTGGHRFWFYSLDKPEGERGASDGLTANLEAVGGPWARTFEEL
jgi:hypothetical protein